MIVSIGRGGPAEAGDRGLFARDLLADAPVRDLTMQSSEPMRISGAPGHEIRAQGKGPGGDPVSLVQWMRFGSGGFLRVIGVSPAGQMGSVVRPFPSRTRRHRCALKFTGPRRRAADCRWRRPAISAPPC